VRTFRCIVREKIPVWFESHIFGGDFIARGSVQCRDFVVKRKSNLKIENKRTRFLSDKFSRLSLLVEACT
jgi:hypothetical protein